MHKVKGNTLVTTTVRDIATRRAVIVDNGDGTFRYTIYHNGVAYLESTWPPEGWKSPQGCDTSEHKLLRLRDYIETVQFGGRNNIGWRVERWPLVTREGNTWFSDEHLGDSGGNPFTAEELEVIRKNWRKPKCPK